MVKNIVAQNGAVACKPLQSASIKTTVRNGVALIENQSNKLIALEVLYSDKDRRYLPGDTIYVTGAVTQHTWAKNSLAIPDENGNDSEERFILVPVEQVVMHSTKRYVSSQLSYDFTLTDA